MRRPLVTVYCEDGRPVGMIEPAGAGGEAEVIVLDERARARVEAVAAHLARPRPPRALGGCVTPSPAPRV